MEELDDETLNDAIADEEYLVVDFWASWCGPCLQMAPVVKKTATDLPGITFGKVDVDRNPHASHQFGIRSIPTFVVFVGGEPVARKMGAMRPEVFRAFVEKSVAKHSKQWRQKERKRRRLLA